MFDSIAKYPRPLRLSIAEGIMASLMSGAGVGFLMAFAVYLGADSIQAGLITALPALIAAFLQLWSLKLLEIYKSRKNIVIATVALQALSWLVIATLPFLFPNDPVNWLIAIATLCTVFGTIGAPLWHSWMRSLTPKEIIGQYFGIRNAIEGFVIFMTTVLCGVMLEYVHPSYTLYAFVGIFGISFFGRAISAIIFNKIEEPEFIYNPKEKISLRTYIKQLGKDNFGHFVLYGTLMTFAIALISPFISFYFLTTLGLQHDYLMYTILISASMLTSIISLPYWGKVIDKYGTIKLLQATGFLACFYPAVLMFVKDPILLIPLQLFDGVAFSGFGLCIANFIYESFKPEKIIKYATFQTMFFGIATFFGTMIGAVLMTFDFSYGVITSAFLAVCFISFLLRVVIYNLLIRGIKEVRGTKFIQKEKLVLSAITFAPVRDSMLENFPILLSATTHAVQRVGRLSTKGIGTVESITFGELAYVESRVFSRLAGIEKVLLNLVKPSRGIAKTSKAKANANAKWKNKRK